MRKKKHCASDVLQALEQMRQKTKIPMCVNPTGAHASLQLLSLQNHCIHFTLITGRDGEGGTAQQWRDVPKATGSNAGQRGPGSVSQKGFMYRNHILDISNAKFQEAWAHMHIPETHIQERRNSDHVIERGESSRGSLTAVGFTHWRPLPPPPSQRHSGRAVRHIHKQHLLSFSLFLRSIGRWWLLYIVDKKRHCIWSVTGNTLKLTQGRTQEATLPFIPGVAA